ncbi:MAG: hypothetical protein PHW24_00535 [Candidatus Moranbacteria bacterium]|nr:hypothetical protein [Candidatus Moranbacteria bacterium]
MKKGKIIFFVSFFSLLAISVAGWFFFGKESTKSINIDNAQAAQPVPVDDQAAIAARFEILQKPKPLPVSMDRVKSQGCVADGLLSEYNPENDKFIDLINRSNCYYLHRSIETWLTPPDFLKAEYIMNKITKKDVVFGMFIAEAINVRSDYADADSGHEFDFKAMCRDGSNNAWGEGTCKPTFSSKEYRRYLQYITRKAIDLGVQSFTFGQIYMQEGGGSKDFAPKIVQEMRDYASQQGVDIIIGAQTGDITDEKYLKLFDYVEGGVGIDSQGNVEDGACLSTRGSCWALLWNDQFSSKANNVLLNLDWTGILSDDLDIFARMDQSTRAQTLKNLYKKFSTRKTGFMMPMFGVINNENNGCRGPKKKFYSPDNSYSCQDENVINKILSGK